MGRSRRGGAQKRAGRCVGGDGLIAMVPPLQTEMTVPDEQVQSGGGQHRPRRGGERVHSGRPLTLRYGELGVELRGRSVQFKNSTPKITRAPAPQPITPGA